MANSLNIGNTTFTNLGNKDVQDSVLLRLREAVSNRSNTQQSQKNRLESELRDSSRDARDEMESDVRERVARQFQQQIQATEAAFAQLQARNEVEQQQRLGQTTALLAARGLAPTVRGGAIREGTVQLGRDIRGETEAQRLGALANINTLQEQEVQRQLGGRVQQDDVLKAQENQRKVLTFLQEGVTDPREIFFQTGGGIPIEEITATIQAATPEVAGADPIRLGATDTLVQFNPETGQYETVGKGIGRATSSSGSGSKLFSLTGSQKTKFIDAGFSAETAADVETLLNQGYTLDQVIEANPEVFSGAQGEALRSIFQPSTSFFAPAPLFGGPAANQSTIGDVDSFLDSIN